MKIFQFQKGMLQVCYALIPCAAASLYLFGWRSLALLALAIVVGAGTEALFTLREGKPVTSAVLVSSMIFALSLPPTIPLWMCAVGMAVGIGIGKMAFGGFGRNIFNPAMVGRCFLYISFPLHMTNRWTEPFRGGPAGLAAWAPPADAMTGATPLEIIRAGGEFPLSSLLFGSTGGALGETSALAVVLGGAWLIARKVAPWRIALSCLFGGAAGSIIFTAAGIEGVPSVPGTFLAGSFLFGAFFVATEPISGAKTKPGQWIYGFAIGALTVVLRTFSNFPEGVMFSVLLMNAFVPLLDRAVSASKAAVSPVAPAGSQ